MSSSNGPRVMYRLKPVYDYSLNFEETKCMYKMTNITSLDQDFKKESSANQYLDLEKRQDQVLKQLELLKNQVQEIKNEVHGISDITKTSKATINTATFPCKGQDIVINANPTSVPYSVWALSHLLQGQGAKVRLSTHQHSSVGSVPQSANVMPQFNASQSRSHQDLSISIIWKNVTLPEMMVNPLAQTWIQGESNIMRYMGECLTPSYRDLEPAEATEVDVWLDRAQFSLLQGSNKERQAFLRSLNSQLGRSSFVVGQSLSFVDLVLWSGICQTGLAKSLPNNVQAWWKRLVSMPAFEVLDDLIVTC